MRCALQRLYSMFPNRFPGAGLLLLRLVCGACVVMDGVTRSLAEPHVPTLLLQSIEVVAALLLLVGLWTPAAGTVIVLVELCMAFSGRSGIENAVLLAALGAGLALLGPGSHSIDAKRYGRKRIELRKNQ
jgi:putative oxidoreductase